jgi:outer membrane immunogenic protein
MFKSTRTTAFGALASYRFMLTPSSAIEANYGIDLPEQAIRYYLPQFPKGIPGAGAHPGDSGAYVRSFNYKKYNPFVEAGPGAFIFLPIRNTGTGTFWM